MNTTMSDSHTPPDRNREIAAWVRKILIGEALPHLSADDWDQLVKFGRTHGLSQVIYHALKDSPPAGLRSSSFKELRAAYYHSAQRNVYLYHELGKALRALRKSDIPVIVLKGACLAELIYGNIALRSMGDVDLLVRREDMARVVHHLGNLGYSAGYDYRIEDELAVCHHLPPMKGPRQLTIEVHWTIVDAPHFAALEEKEIARIWERAREVVIAGASVLMLAPEDLMLHLCVHFSIQHLCDIRLLSLLDLKKVIQYYGDAMDWDQLRPRTSERGVERAVRLTLYLAEKWVGLVLPERLKHEWILSQMDPDLLNWVEDKVLGKAAPYKANNLSEFIESKGISAKARVLWDRLFLPPAMVARQLKINTTSWKVYLYYPVGWLSLLMRHGHNFWMAFTGESPVTRNAQRENALRQWFDE